MSDTASQSASRPVADVSSGDLEQIAQAFGVNLDGKGQGVIRIDAWVEHPSGHQANNPLLCVRMATAFYVRTADGKHHEGALDDFLVEDYRGRRWVVSRAVFNGLFGA